jgi:hypothetical protein
MRPDGHVHHRRRGPVIDFADQVIAEFRGNAQPLPNPVEHEWD